MKNINYIIFLLLLISCSDKSNELIEISHAKYFNDKNFKEIKKVNHEIFNDNFIGYPVRVISIDISYSRRYEERFYFSYIFHKIKKIFR